MTAIWEHLALYKGTIRTTTPWLSQPQRGHDTALMQMVTASDFTNTQKKQINACRIYLQVVPPSDIATFDGIRITQQAYDGIREGVANVV
jgi:hypothetical protein